MRASTHLQARPQQRTCSSVTAAAVPLPPRAPFRRSRCCMASPSTAAGGAPTAPTPGPACATNSTSSTPTAAAAAAAAAQQAVPSGLPATYRRLVAESTGASFREVARVVEEPLPAPGPGEVLVRIAYAGINGGCETFRARGEHAFAPNRNRSHFPLGAEGAGTVAALGEGVTSLTVGQTVAVNGAAAFSEYAVAKAAMCTPVPAATPEAVALVLSAVTACCALEATAAVKPGQTVLVTAAAGGTGHFGLQLAKIAGCRVVAVTGSPSKVEALKGLGADLVICHTTEDLDAVLSRECPTGVDVMYEGVGGDLRRRLLPHLAPGGKLLQVGYISEYPHALPPGAAVSAGPDGTPLDALFWGGQRVELEGGRVVYGQVWPSDPRAIRRCKKRVFDLHAAGQLAAWTDLSHGFSGVEGVADAIEYMLKGGHTGKVVIPIAPTLVAAAEGGR